MKNPLRNLKAQHIVTHEYNSRLAMTAAIKKSQAELSRRGEISARLVTPWLHYTKRPREIPLLSRSIVPPRGLLFAGGATTVP